MQLIAFGWTARLLAMGVSLAMVRVALRVLGESQFAVFQVLVTALAWGTLASFGLGPALKNLVSEARARGEPDDAMRAAASALIALCFLIGITLLLLAAPAATALLLRKLSHDQLWAYRAFVSGGILSLVAALGQIGTEVLYAEDRASRVYLLSIVASIATILALLRLQNVARAPAELVFWVVTATLAPQALAGLIGLMFTGLAGHAPRRPSEAAVRALGILGMRFWGFALLSNLILMVDGFVISQILVARDIVMYSIMMKVVTVGLVLFTTVIAVVWPEWTRAWELREYDALRAKVFGLATAGVAICVPGALGAVVVVPPLLHLWLHDANVLPSSTVIVAFIAYLAVRIWTDVHSSALMAGNRIGSATLFAVLQAVITAPLEYVCGRIWGAEGVILGLLAGFLATAAWMFPHRFYGELRALSRSSGGAVATQEG